MIEGVMGPGRWVNMPFSCTAVTATRAAGYVLAGNGRCFLAGAYHTLHGVKQSINRAVLLVEENNNHQSNGYRLVLFLHFKIVIRFYGDISA